MAEQLSGNTSLLADVRARVRDGLRVWAECGGLLWLARSLDGHTMAGVVQTEATITTRLRLGYRTALCRTATPLGQPGPCCAATSSTTPAFPPTATRSSYAARLGSELAGFATPTLVASYLHIHLAGQPQVAEAFVRSAVQAAAAGAGSSRSTSHAS